MITHEETRIHQVDHLHHIHQLEGTEYIPLPSDISPEEAATAFDETAMSEADALQSIVDAMNQSI